MRSWGKVRDTPTAKYAECAEGTCFYYRLRGASSNEEWDSWSRSLQYLAHSQALALAEVKHRVGAGLLPGYGPAHKITAEPYAARLRVFQEVILSDTFEKDRVRSFSAVAFNCTNLSSGGSYGEADRDIELAHIYVSPDVYH